MKSSEPLQAEQCRYLADCYNSAMKIEEIRRRRLEKLCDDHGGVRAVAERTGLSEAALNQVIRKVLLPARKGDGLRVPKSLGKEAARVLEKAYGLGDGWFDWPFYAVDFRAWAALNEAQQAYVQGQLHMALENAAKIVATDVQRYGNDGDRRNAARQEEEDRKARQRAVRKRPK